MSGPPRTVFLGSGEFAVAPAQAALEDAAVDLVAVITAPPRPAGRGRSDRPTPIAQWAADVGLSTLTPARLRTPEAIAELAGLAPELLVLADYGQIVPQQVLDLPRHGALNLHPSLLPRWRGASPIPAAILAGDERTGVTIIKMDAGLDSGPIVAQRETEIRPGEATPELETRLSTMAADLLAGTLAGWLAGKIEPRPQPAEDVTLTRPLRRADGLLDPTKSATELERQVRAYQPWPGSYLDIGGERVVVWRARLAATPPGDCLALSTADGYLELLDVQPAAGRRMAAADFMRGRPGLVRVR